MVVLALYVASFGWECSLFKAAVEPTGMRMTAVRVRNGMLVYSDMLAQTGVLRNHIAWQFHIREFTLPSRSAFSRRLLRFQSRPLLGLYILPLLYVPAVLSAATGVLWWTHRRTRRGGCRACGYDRSGLVEDAVCPECGASAR